MKIDLNKLLAFLGAAAQFAPDVAGASVWLAAHGVGWLSYVARGLGVAALLLASLPRILPKARQVLSSFGLATAPGAVAPVPVVAAKDQTSGDAPGKVLPISTDPPKGGAALVILLAAGLTLAACKTLAPAPDSFAGRVVTCAEGNDANPAASAAVLGCLVGAAGGDYAACLAGLPAAGHWSADAVACIVRSYAQPRARAMLAAQPVADPAREHAAEWLRDQGITFRQ
jgi:hypothetical protein